MGAYLNEYMILAIRLYKALSGFVITSK